MDLSFVRNTHACSLQLQYEKLTQVHTFLRNTHACSQQLRYEIFFILLYNHVINTKEMLEQFQQNKREIGSEGEAIAVDFLKQKGFNIIKKNFHFGKIGEIDIIAEDNKTLVFVEVKLRSSNSFGNPLESISARKQNSLKKCAEGFLYKNKIFDRDCRFDVITINTKSKTPVIEHIINAFW